MNITVEITNERILSLLCNAFEGGVNYWVTEVEAGEPPLDPDALKNITAHGDNYWHWSQTWPALGGWITVVEQDTETGKLTRHRLDHLKIKDGLRLMAKNSPKYFADVLTGDTDVETGDVFLQWCLLQELKYG